MEKMREREPPFAEQALHLIKASGLLNAVSEFARMMDAYSVGLEGLRAEHYFESVAFSFAGVAFGLDLG